MQYQEIVLGLADQTFFYDPPEGRPTASRRPTVGVSDGEASVSATSGECSIDGVETVLQYGVRSGSTAFVVADAASIAPGVRYLLTNPTVDTERVEVVAIAGNRIMIRHPIIHDFESGSTIVGCRISIAVDPAWVADAANLSNQTTKPGVGLAAYRLRWTYTLGGIETIGLSFIDLVRHHSKGLVTPREVDERFPGWIAGLPFEHRANQGADFIAEAFTAVRCEALGDFAQHKLRDTVVLRELVRIRAHVIRLEHDVMHGAPRAAELEVANRRYRASYTQLVEKPGLVAGKRDDARPSEPLVKAIGSQPGKAIIQLPTPFPPKLTRQ